MSPFFVLSFKSSQSAVILCTSQAIYSSFIQVLLTLEDIVSIYIIIFFLNVITPDNVSFKPQNIGTKHLLKYILTKDDYYIQNLDLGVIH